MRRLRRRKSTSRAMVTKEHRPEHHERGRELQHSSSGGGSGRAEPGRRSRPMRARGEHAAAPAASSYSSPGMPTPGRRGCVRRVTRRRPKAERLGDCIVRCARGCHDVARLAAGACGAPDRLAVTPAARARRLVLRELGQCAKPGAEADTHGVCRLERDRVPARAGRGPAHARAAQSVGEPVAGELGARI